MTNTKSLKAAKTTVSKAKRPIAGRRIAKFAFTPDAFMAKVVQQEKTFANWFNYLSRLDDIEVKLATDKRGRSYPSQERPGAMDAAERTDDGMVGIHLRKLRSDGYWSNNELVREFSEYRALSKINSEVRRLLDKDRGNSLARTHRQLLASASDQWLAMLDHIDACNKAMGESIKNDPD